MCIIVSFKIEITCFHFSLPSSIVIIIFDILTRQRYIYIYYEIVHKSTKSRTINIPKKQQYLHQSLKSEKKIEK